MYCSATTRSPSSNGSAGLSTSENDFEERRADGDGHRHRESADQRQPAMLDEHADAEPGIERDRVNPPPHSCHWRRSPVFRLPFLYLGLHKIDNDGLRGVHERLDAPTNVSWT